MSRKRTREAPSVEEVGSYDNVPIELASAFIGMSSKKLCEALQHGTAPFGFAAKNMETGTWTYNISPGLLISYKDGSLPAWRLDDVIKLAMTGINDVLQMQRQAAAELILGFGGAAREPYK